ncbi:hypothetical protein JOF29_001578 [Kribbella aluminosa]|uniref:Uncharacterized protein n=1 Tax=Kribbella aluminosa TaxID=416017 RepID=A0ABS4UFT1_9ACTN|nr:hypothetical protein [Kribbella aluminosa]MBP2350495.1 hypothetical protein [Kribbella aluminosa]
MNALVSLSLVEFDVLQRVALQFTDISSRFLESINATDEDVERIWSLLDSAGAADGAVQAFQLDVSADEGQLARIHVEAQSVRICVTRREHSLICQLGTRAQSGFGDPELYYRTGYRMPQIRDVFKKICG